MQWLPGVGGSWEWFDFQYLASLSTDAVPTMARLYQESETHDEHLAAAIACHAFMNDEYAYDSYSYSKEYTWSSYNYSRSQALKDWQSPDGITWRRSIPRAQR